MSAITVTLDKHEATTVLLALDMAERFAATEEHVAKKAGNVSKGAVMAAMLEHIAEIRAKLRAPGAEL